QRRGDGEAMVAMLVPVAQRQVGLALLLQRLGLVLGGALAGGFVRGLGLVAVGPWRTGVGGDGVHVLLQALGLGGVPLVGGPVLGQPRLVGLDDGAAALVGLQAARRRRQHR